MFDMESETDFLNRADTEFLQAIGSTFYYRLTATPVPVNQGIDLRDRRQSLIDLLQHPPKCRNGGWDLTSSPDALRVTCDGIMTEPIDFRHLRLFWNGHIEFWNSGEDFYFDQINGLDEPDRSFLFPYAIIEPAENFVMLVLKICNIAEYVGDIRLFLGLYNIRGHYLAPYDPKYNTDGYRYGRQRKGCLGGPQAFEEQHLKVRPVTVKVSELPGSVTWRLVSQVYYCFGYNDSHIPCFDDGHHCILC